jgi:hypothetical protein
MFLLNSPENDRCAILVRGSWIYDKTRREANQAKRWDNFTAEDISDNDPHTFFNLSIRNGTDGVTVNVDCISYFIFKQQPHFLNCGNRLRETNELRENVDAIIEAREIVQWKKSFLLHCKKCHPSNKTVHPSNV